MTAHPLARPTAEEYLAFEEWSEERHEFFDGFVSGMTAATDTHERVAGNFFVILHAHLRGKKCQVFKAGMRLRVRCTDRDWFYYPDVMVACDPADNDWLFRERPVLLAEVLSGDERRDLVEKYLAFQRIASLEEYVVFSQDPERPEARIFRRDDAWQLGEVHREAAAQFTLRSIGLTLALGDLYAQ